MQFDLYTDKTVSQALNAVHERLQAKPTKSRPEFDGWIQKDGHFTMSTTIPVARIFSRTTRLHGRLERVGNATTVHVRVAVGMTQEGQAILFGAILVLAALVLLNGNAVLGLLIAIVGLAAYIPLKGDYHNSEVLVKDLRRILKAKETPPSAKKTTTKRRSKRS